jgi:hypothetical protein
MENITHVPHKIRIKQRVHSAFAKDNSVDWFCLFI